MKIPLLKKSEAKRQKIFEKSLAVAKEVAANEGMNGLTARRIARGAGCSVGTVYNVFGNLDTVILYLNAMTLDALYEELARVKQTDDPTAQVGELVARYMKFTDENMNLWNVLFQHVWPKDHEFPDWYQRRIDGLLSILAGTLEPFFTDEQKTEQIQAATVLWCGLHGISSLAVSGKLGTVSSESALGMADMLTQNFIEGLGQR